MGEQGGGGGEGWFIRLPRRWGIALGSNIKFTARKAPLAISGKEEQAEQLYEVRSVYGSCGDSWQSS